MYNMSPYSLSRSFRDKPCRAVIYGRASTEHEAQVKALQNQMQWYDDVARFHPQWNVINRYIDQGITGTQVYNRNDTSFFCPIHSEPAEHQNSACGLFHPSAVWSCCDEWRYTARTAPLK